MTLKEKKAPASLAASGESGAHKKLSGTAAALFLSALAGFLAAGTRLGGGAPLCAAIAASLPISGGAASFAGAMVSFLLYGTFSSSLTEAIAMPAVIFARALITSVFGRKASPFSSGALAAASYVICGVAAAFAFKTSAALIIAVIFRGAVCGGAAYFISKVVTYSESGFGITLGTKASAAAVYVISVCMLCGVSFGAVNAGRIAGLFVSVAAAFRYGAAGGAAAGALSAFAFGAASPSMAYSAAVTVCAGLVSGTFSKKSKFVSAMTFLLTGFMGLLVYGMPQDAVRLTADMTAAAALFYVVPEKLYRRPFGRLSAPPSAAVGGFGNRMRFAAEAVSDVRDSFSKAAGVLEKGGFERDISAETCRRVCAGCRSSAFCGDSTEHRINAYFRPAERLLAARGYIGEKELPPELEHCPRRSALAETLNGCYRLSRMEERLGDVNAELRELTVEQLSEAEEMFRSFGSGAEELPACDETLSEYVREALEEFGAKAPSASVFYDRDGRMFIECYCSGTVTEKGNKLSERLCEITDRELDEPVSVTFGGMTRLCFHEIPVYSAEIGRAAVSGRDGASGDSDAVFYDGLGNLFMLLSDGMGSGVRAAVESRMTVSVMTRAIRAGLGADTAVRLINRLLMTKSPEEIFATADMLKINLFTGKTEALKLGAAQTFLKTNGTVKTVESWSSPLGIVGSCEICRRTAALSDSDEAVMITDGITEDCFPRVRELMLSIGVTAQECAERIIAEAEKNKEENLYRQDDKTVLVVKIHKIHS